MPTSWLKPRAEVQRSILPLSTAMPLTQGVYWKLSPGSRSFQVAPSLPDCVRWVVMVALFRFEVDDGSNCTVRRVGENFVPIGPAPAQMVAPSAFLFAFHTSFTVYDCPCLRRTAVCTKAAFGENVPA